MVESFDESHQWLNMEQLTRAAMVCHAMIRILLDCSLHDSAEKEVLTALVGLGYQKSAAMSAIKRQRTTGQKTFDSLFRDVLSALSK